jgi:Bestrophin, RFP-TM, chloride channel
MNISTQLNVRICLIVVVRTVQSFNFVDGVNLMINFLDLESVQKVLYKGPKENKNGHCKNNRNKVNWSLLPSSCSACNCNGHVEGIQGSIYRNKNAQEQIWKCSSCLHNTSGDQCQYCLSEHQGSPINERKCFPCKCILDNSAAHCNPNGLCEGFCTGKGRIGKLCNECDIYNFAKFHGMCVNKSKTNFKYISNETDNYNTYLPVFGIFKFLSYVGWFKVGLSFINPFGKEQSDLPLGSILDYNLEVSTSVSRANDFYF